MKSELQITFRNMKPSEEIEELVRAGAAKLDALYSQLMGCRVMIEIPHRHHKKGSPYHVRIDLTVPQGEIVVKREPSLSGQARQSGKRDLQKNVETQIPHKDLRIAISDAFKAAGRRLQDYARRQRGDIKTHAPLPEARVSQIFPREGYGFLVSEDGREIYFHKNSVLGQGFLRLKVRRLSGLLKSWEKKGLRPALCASFPNREFRKRQKARRLELTEQAWGAPTPRASD